jgi:hypothetical protein
VSPISEQILVSLRNHPIREPWERTVVDVAVSVLTREGIRGLGMLAVTPEKLHDPGTLLTLREMSELMSVLENAEADRVERTHEILREILAFAMKAAEELLKAALGGLL